MSATIIAVLAIVALAAIYAVMRYAIGFAIELHRSWGWPPHRTSLRSYLRVEYSDPRLPICQIDWVHPVGIWNAFGFLAHLAEPGCVAEMGPMRLSPSTTRYRINHTTETARSSPPSDAAPKS